MLKFLKVSGGLGVFRGLGILKVKKNIIMNDSEESHNINKLQMRCFLRQHDKRKIQ